ncbi:hypothetical protein MMC07_008171 [Pseudocyphellaria aurata]|nr:hypothetical protein [Pseudocyphellaria aurata]
MSLFPFPRVAIVGAGLAGCTLARLLRNAAIPVTVFEREASINVLRSHDSSLELQGPAGLRVLREAGLYDEFLKYARFGTGGGAMFDKNLKKYLSTNGPAAAIEGGRPKIDYSWLRQIEVYSLPPEIFRWGHRLQSIEDDLSMRFDHGLETGYDLIVGADGAWSKVRPILSTVQPVYAGIGGLSLKIKNGKELQPDLYELVKRGPLLSYSDSKFIGAQLMGDDSLGISAWSKREENWTETCGYNVSNAKDAKGAALKEYSDWAEPLKKMIEVADDDIKTNSLYELPVEHPWKSRPGVTLIGDAAHLSTPFPDEGANANAAMADALNLSYEIIAAAKATEPFQVLNNGLDVFGKHVFERGAETLQKSRANMVDLLFTPGAPATTFNRYSKRLLVKGWKRYWVPNWLVRDTIERKYMDK